MAKISDIPCYIDEDIVEKSSELISELLDPILGPSSFLKVYLTLNVINDKLVDEESECQKHKKYEKYIPGCIQIFAAIELNNFEASENDLSFKKMVMQSAARHVHFEVIKTLAPLLENPNESINQPWNRFYAMETPIFEASRNGHLEIIKFLVPLSDNLTSTAIMDAEDIATLYDHDQVSDYFQELPEARHLFEDI